MRAQIEPPEGWAEARALLVEAERLGYFVVEWRRVGRPVYVLLGGRPADPWAVPPI